MWFQSGGETPGTIVQGGSRNFITYLFLKVEMKTILIISVTLLLSACGSSENYQPRAPQEVCSGKLERIDGKHYRMTCADGQVMNYTSYKYDIKVNGQ
jgi:hypothetical protein